VTDELRSRKRIEALEKQLFELLERRLRPVGKAAGPLLYKLQRLRNRQGRRGVFGFTKFVTKKLGLALSTAYHWINQHKERLGIRVPNAKPFPKLGKGQGKKASAPRYNQQDLEKFEKTPYVRELSLFTYGNTKDIISMCEDKDLQQFLGAVDKYDCAYKAVRFAYTEAKARARTSSSGTPKENRSPDVESGLHPVAVTAVPIRRLRPSTRSIPRPTRHGVARKPQQYGAKL
jgi:hypothetical protein